MFESNTTVLYGINSLTEIVKKSISGEVLYATTTGEGFYGGIKLLDVIDVGTLSKSKNISIIICSMYVAEITESLLSEEVTIGAISYYNSYLGTVFPVSTHQSENFLKNELLYAFYDMSTSLASFDIYRFALVAEAERRIKGLKQIHFIIVPKRSIRPGSINVYVMHDEEDIKWRIDHILIPILNCIPSTIGVSNLAYREEVNNFLSVDSRQIYPSGYSLKNVNKMVTFSETIKYISSPNDFSFFETSSQSIEMVANYIKEFVGNKKIITITLREYGYPDKRNNNLIEWEKFINSLDTTIYYPIIIRDTYKSTTKLPLSLRKISDFPLASIDIGIRVALYKVAYLNFCVPNGPTVLLFHIKGCHTLLIRHNDDSVHSVSKHTVELDGFPEDEQPIFAEEGKQYVYWGEETYDNITDAFEQYEKNRIS